MASKTPEASIPSPSPEQDQLPNLSQQELADMAKLRQSERLASFIVGSASMPDSFISPEKPQKGPEKLTEYEHASEWGNAALNGRSFSVQEGLWPKTRREWRKAESAYNEKKHLGTLNAAVTVGRKGPYAIGKDGLSALRVNGSLGHLPRSFRGSIKRAEKHYRKTVEKRDHALHVLEHSGEPFIRIKARRDHLKHKTSHATHSARQAVGKLDQTVTGKIFEHINDTKVGYHEGRSGQFVSNGLVQEQINHLARVGGKRIAKRRIKKQERTQRQAQNHRGVV